MKNKILVLCTAGLISVNLCIPAAGASLSNIRTHVDATPAVEKIIFEADKAGTVSFQNLASRIRTNNPSINSLQFTLDSQKAFSREQAYHDLLEGINGLSDAAWYLATNNKDTSSVQANVESMSKQLESLKPENYEKTLKKLSLQIEQTIQQIIMGGESLFLNILSTESALSDLNRSIKNMERTIKEMELRLELGQVSKLSLEQLKSSYASAKSQASTMELSIQKMKDSLQVLLGDPPTGTLALVTLPSPSQKQIPSLHFNYDTALHIAKDKSLTLSIASLTLDDAEKTWDDAKDNIWYHSYQYKMAEKTYYSAVYTHDSTVKNFELSFKNLYDSIPDAQQSLTTAESALTFQKQNHITAQAKHKLGQISDTAFQNAEDSLLSAKEAVKVAQIKLFTIYNQYQWALERGMLE